MNSKTSQQAGSPPERWEVVGWPDGSLGAIKWECQSTTSSKGANGATQMLVQNLRPAIVVIGEQRSLVLSHSVLCVCSCSCDQRKERGLGDSLGSRMDLNSCLTHHTSLPVGYSVAITVTTGRPAAQQDTEARVVTRRQPRSLTQDPLFLLYYFPLELPRVSGDTEASQLAGTQWLAQGKLPGRQDGTELLPVAAQY